MDKLQETLQREGVVQLQQFLPEKELAILMEKIKLLKFIKSYKPLTHYYTSAVLPVSDLNGLFSFLKVLGMRITRARAYKLRWKNYSVLHDSIKQREYREIILDLTESWEESWGGACIYVDDSGDYQKIPWAYNSVMVIEKKRAQRFFQYCNHYAQERLVVIAQVQREER